jgi:hypothetical protein
MTKVGKAMKSVAGTAFRAAAAAATAVVVDKMTDAIAERVQELAETGSKPKRALRSSVKSTPAPRGKNKKLIKKATSPKAPKKGKEKTATQKKKV